MTATRCPPAHLAHQQPFGRQFRTEIQALAARGTQALELQALELQKALTLEMMQDRYRKSPWTHVFTDGSAENAVRNGGSGAFIHRLDGTISSLSILAGDLSSNYRAEVHTSCHRTPD